MKAFTVALLSMFNDFFPSLCFFPSFLSFYLLLWQEAKSNKNKLQCGKLLINKKWLLARTQDISFQQFNSHQLRRSRASVSASSVGIHPTVVTLWVDNQNILLHPWLRQRSNRNSNSLAWRHSFPQCQTLIVSRRVIIHTRVPRSHLSARQTGNIRSKQ